MLKRTKINHTLTPEIHWDTSIEPKDVDYLEYEKPQCRFNFARHRIAAAPLGDSSSNSRFLCYRAYQITETSSGVLWNLTDTLRAVLMVGAPLFNFIQLTKAFMHQSMKAICNDTQNKLSPHDYSLIRCSILLMNDPTSTCRNIGALVLLKRARRRSSKIIYE